MKIVGVVRLSRVPSRGVQIRQIDSRVVDVNRVLYTAREGSGEAQHWSLALNLGSHPGQVVC